MGYFNRDFNKLESVSQSGLKKNANDLQNDQHPGYIYTQIQGIMDTSTKMFEYFHFFNYPAESKFLELFYQQFGVLGVESMKTKMFEIFNFYYQVNEK